jgi:hypothetical protein
VTWFGWWYVIAAGVGAAGFVVQGLLFHRPGEDAVPLLKRLGGFVLTTLVAGLAGGLVLYTVFGTAVPAQ